MSVLLVLVEQIRGIQTTQKQPQLLSFLISSVDLILPPSSSVEEKL